MVPKSTTLKGSVWHLFLLQSMLPLSSFFYKSLLGRSGGRADHWPFSWRKLILLKNMSPNSALTLITNMIFVFVKLENFQLKTADFGIQSYISFRSCHMNYQFSVTRENLLKNSMHTFVAPSMLFRMGYFIWLYIVLKKN
jgi:hypothetical protein